MGWVEVAVYAAVMIVAAVVSYVVASSYTPGETTQDPLAALSTTTVREGSVLPVVYGTVRIAGNLLYYGGLKSTPNMVAASGGGKGGGGGDAQQQGYNYQINVWQGICMGKVQLIHTIVNDDPERKIQRSQTIWNDGTMTTYPNWIFDGVVEKATILSGSGPNYSLGATKIQPKTVALGLTIYVNEKGDIVSLAVKDDGKGKFTNSAGTEMAGWSINYLTGVITTATALAGVRVDFYHGDGKGSDTVYAGPLKGIAHIAYEQWFVGANVYHIPTIHFIVKRIMPLAVDYANMTNGTNPAAVIHDVLMHTLYGYYGDDGSSSAHINLATFNAAAKRWYDMGYGINFAVSSQTDAATVIERVLGWVGGSLYIDEDGRYALQAFDPDDEPLALLEQDDFIEFQITRQGWDSTKNDLRFTYVDSLSNYVSRTFGLYDRANATIQGVAQQSTVDLTCFTDVTTVSKRAWEVLKTSSYPGLTLSFKLLEGRSTLLHVGCVVSISHEQYGINDAKFRITKAELGDQDSLEVLFSAEQMLEALIDSTFGQPVSSIPDWTPPDYTPLPLAFAHVFELPWNPVTQYTPFYALLGARVGYEHESNNHQSIVNGTSDFHYLNTTSLFAQYGTLDVAYPATTYEIDDEQGIIYTPYRNDLNPADLLRAETFLNTRFILIGNEIMGIQQHIPYGDGAAFQALGVIRGLFGTTIAHHNAGAGVWIFPASNVMVPISGTQPFWIKMIPATSQGSADASAVTAIGVTPSGKAAATPGVDVIMATVAAGSFTATWFPIVREYTGAGMGAEDTSRDSWPFDRDGDFEYRIGSGTPVNIAACSVTLAISGNITFSVRQRVDGQYSGWTSISIANTNGNYLSEIGAVAY